MNTSDEINELAAALSAAQGAIKSAPKDADNPFYKSKYATLDSCWQAIRKPLADNGLSIIQAPGYDTGKLTLTTRLVHSSGQWIETVLAIEPEKPTVQSMGSTITYLRRYSLALIGVTTEEDDDGEAAPDAKPAKNGKGKTEMTPSLLLTRLQKETDIADYYKDVKHIFNAMKKELGEFVWPRADDMDSWKEVFNMAAARARAHIETAEQPPLVEVPEADQHIDALTEG